MGGCRQALGAGRQPLKRGGGRRAPLSHILCRTCACTSDGLLSSPSVTWWTWGGRGAQGSMRECVPLHRLVVCQQRPQRRRRQGRAPGPLSPGSYCVRTHHDVTDKGGCQVGHHARHATHGVPLASNQDVAPVGRHVWAGKEPAQPGQGHVHVSLLHARHPFGLRGALVHQDLEDLAGVPADDGSGQQGTMRDTMRGCGPMQPWDHAAAATRAVVPHVRMRFTNAHVACMCKRSRGASMQW